MKKLLFIGILLMGLSLQGWTQEKTITVTGIVTDTEKEPLIGVNISVQNMPWVSSQISMEGTGLVCRRIIGWSFRMLVMRRRMC